MNMSFGNPTPPMYRNPYSSNASDDTTGIGQADMQMQGEGKWYKNPFVIISVVQLVGSLIQGLTRRRDPITPEQQSFKDMTKYYRDLGERMKSSNTYKRTMIPNRTPKNYTINYSKLMNDHPYPDGA